MIRATATLTLSRTGKSDTLKLDLLDLDVEQVTVDGHVSKFARTPELVAIPLPAKRGAVPTYSVAVRYGGAVMDGLIVRRDSAGRWTYFGDNWPNRARHWIPSIDHPSDKATVTWRVFAPADANVMSRMDGFRSPRRRRRRTTAAGTLSVWRESRRDRAASHGHRRRAAHRIRAR